MTQSGGVPQCQRSVIVGSIEWNLQSTDFPKSQDRKIDGWPENSNDQLAQEKIKAWRQAYIMRVDLTGLSMNARPVSTRC